jgi:hypothetical protein
VSQLQVGRFILLPLQISQPHCNFSTDGFPTATAFFLLSAVSGWRYWMRNGSPGFFKSTYAADYCNREPQRFSFADEVESAVLTVSVQSGVSHASVQSGTLNVETFGQQFPFFFFALFWDLTGTETATTHQPNATAHLITAASTDNAIGVGTGFGFEALSKLFCCCFHCLLECHAGEGISGQLLRYKSVLEANAGSVRETMLISVNNVEERISNKLSKSNLPTTSQLIQTISNGANLAAQFMVKSRLLNLSLTLFMGNHQHNFTNAIAGQAAQGNKNSIASLGGQLAAGGCD